MTNSWWRSWPMASVFLVGSVGFFLFLKYADPQGNLPWASSRPSSVSIVGGGNNNNHNNHNSAEIGLGHHSNSQRPPLSKLVDDRGNIKADVQWLLDFAIIGHPKTATTAMMLWLASEDEVQMYTHEVHSLFKGKPAELVELMYALPEGPNYKRGYKLPTDIQSLTTLTALRQYWGHTKLIVGVRHPIKWMESYYNFRSRKGSDMVPAEEMVGDALPDRIYFHNHLAMLGKTDVQSPEEEELLTVIAGEVANYEPMTNEVFLYDVSQPFDGDEGRNLQFRQDMQSFLGLEEPLDRMEVRSKSRNYHYAIDICDDKYRELRSDIMIISRAASTWIRTYFLTHKDVTVSSPKHFEELMASWMEDPCDIRDTTKEITKYDNDNRPPLSDLVKRDKVIGDPEFLLDFAIVGHAKCATTLLMHWIGKHDDVQMYNKEEHQLTFGHPAKFVELMYALPAGSQYKRAYKAPNDMSHQMPRSLLQKYFPHVGLVMGIRHPVKWFESWYNFKSRQGYDMSDPLSMRELPFQVRFHTHCAMMGKTPLSDDEMNLVEPYMLESDEPLPMKHPVFLYEVSQPFDKNETRNLMFREDLSKFLGLSSTLEELKPRAASRNFHYAIDICENKYTDLRRDLLDLGEAMSTWFLKYFLPLDDVTLSSPDHVKEILATWGTDPCADKDRARRQLYN